MDRKSFFGLVLCGAVFVAGFAISGNVAQYFNLAAIFVVAGGTLGVAIASFRMQRLQYVARVLRNSYRARMKEPAEIVEILVDLSVKSRIRGLHTLAEDERETSIMFLRRALGFVVDNYSREQTADILNTEMFFFKQRRDESERVLRVLAEVCPAIGLAGSVVGLIGMLSGVNDTSVVLSTIPIALTSTLYGVLLANFVFLPMAARIREVTDHELLLQKIIVEGVRAIQSELNPRVLEVKLKSFLTPAARQGQLVSLARIKERFQIEDRVEDMPAMPTPEEIGVAL
ncbi:motility protein A [Desulfomicrobium escambiense]|uniref:motility protein A n=1 Tax=Desulfomicrobium escambiense TaxID=29503 RepID=UPI0004012293|nr:MotA/TolQ/ExbB proton channel family protein [Desulfomicrobium escambiense]